MSELSPRKKRILEAVVVEYVQAGEPVASDVVVRKYELGVRGATVRSEMAEITELGLLEKPYSSAGRIPSDKGYRYYVDQLIVTRPPTHPEKRKIGEATSEEDTLNNFLASTARALAHITHLLSVATVNRNREARVRHLLITGLSPGRCLLVMVMENGHVENRMVETPVETDLTHIAAVNEALARACKDRSLRELAVLSVPKGLDKLATAVASATIGAVKAAAKELQQGKLVAEGHEFVLAQPEFIREEEAAREVLDGIEDENAIRASLGRTGISIGSENPDKRFRRLTVIQAPFKVGGQDTGVLALIGPTRLEYDRAISLLDFTAKALGAALDDLTA
ncbi:MAG: heat-inducible transcription repressor HrcA [Fimbriimonadaceae bacterium]|nr:heat-inducible transcription repressor HrcA [Fimbriimonadaceae bacterium]